MFEGHYNIADKNIGEKKEWQSPMLQIIAFKQTKNGTASSVEETLGGTVGTLS
jgi:hypothetical protein